MKLEWKTVKVKVDELKLLDFNPRTITEEKKKKLSESIEKFNLVEIPVIDFDNTVIAGNQRVSALIILGREKEIIDVRKPNRKLTTKELKEYVVLSNTHAGEFDFEILKSDFAELDLHNFDFEIAGIEDWQTEQERNSVSEDNYVPPEEIKTDIKLGDVFDIESADGTLHHRVMCGDSTKKEDVEKLMGGGKWTIGFTSPPYNSGNADFTYDYKAKKQGGFYRNNKDDLDPHNYKKLLISVLSNYLFFADEKHSLFWNQMYNANSRDDYGKIIFSENNVFKVRETIIWNKQNGFAIAADNCLSRNAEIIFLLSNSKKYLSNATPKSVYWNRWDISNQNSQDSDNKHKACFPIALPSKALTDFSKENNLCLDLFLGSGSTLIASHQLKRNCYGMEIDPIYVQVILDRIKKFDPSIKIKYNGKSWQNFTC